MSIKSWIAEKLYPKAFTDQRAYQRMKVEASDAYWWLNGYPDAADALRWILDNDHNRRRSLDEKPVGHLPSQISDFRSHLERRRKATTPAPVEIVVGTVPCPCTLIEQDEDCPIGYPSLLCGICEGKGHTTQDQVTALACEMIKVVSDMGEPEDPFAAWESIDLIKSQNDQIRKAAAAYVASVYGEPEKDCWDTEDGKEAPVAERFASDWSWKAYDDTKQKAFDALRAALSAVEGPTPADDTGKRGGE